MDAAEALALVSEGTVTVKQAVRKYGLPASMVRRLMREGVLSYAVIDDRGTRLVSEVDLQRYLARLLQRAT